MVNGLNVAGKYFANLAQLNSQEIAHDAPPHHRTLKVSRRWALAANNLIDFSQKEQGVQGTRDRDLLGCGRWFSIRTLHQRQYVTPAMKHAGGMRSPGVQRKG